MHNSSANSGVNSGANRGENSGANRGVNSNGANNDGSRCDPAGFALPSLSTTEDSQKAVLILPMLS
jgi:hypothetical protein